MQKYSLHVSVTLGLEVIEDVLEIEVMPAEECLFHTSGLDLHWVANIIDK